MELAYDQPEAGHPPQYNGNIASQRWVSRVDATPLRRGFNYLYDPATRLMAAGYYSNARSESAAHLKENHFSPFGLALKGIEKTGSPIISTNTTARRSRVNWA
jgi:hypothetical protein